MVNRTSKKLLLTLIFVIGGVVRLSAQEPLYIVNGEPRSGLGELNPELIEHIEQLPADEETIARFGPEAGNGVVLVTLKYDEPARFCHPEGLSLGEYVTREVRWRENDPTARIVIRYTIEADGSLKIEKVLEATDKRLLRRVESALQGAVTWQPAQKSGQAVRSGGYVLQLTLPEGREMPRERYIIIR